MVSFKSALSPASRAAAAAFPMKRKRGVDDDEDSRGGIELSLDAAPLPLEWQRCLDIKSGQIHYYNTRTHKRTWTRPRGDHHQRQHGGLDLELNLAFDPRRAGAGEDRRLAEEEEAATPPVPDAAWEMVAAGCMRCHMLVMMCRACPACPNCKFLHPMGSQPGAVARASPPAEAAAPAKLGLRLFENTS